MSEKKAQVVIADVVDFYRQWPELRERAEHLVETREMAQEDAELLRWMIKMVDMVGPNDIIREK
jgi:hypothetical protein